MTQVETSRTIHPDTQAHFLIPPHELQRYMVVSYGDVTSITARDAFDHLIKKHSDYRRRNDGLAPTTDITDLWKNPADAVAVASMQRGLNRIYHLRTLSVGSEGAKDGADSVQGLFGPDGKPIMWSVSDAIEGTTVSSRFEPGSVSAKAVTEAHGIMPTPKDNLYMVKLVAPPQAKGIISLDLPHEENLDRVIQVLGIKPNELTQVTLDPKKRPINQPFVDAALRVGVNLKLINSGDLLPGLLASMDPHSHNKGAHILVGRGGIEEGTITAAGVRLHGGFMEARFYDENPAIYNQNELLRLDTHLAPGDPKTTIVAISGITGDPNWFDIPPVQELGDGSHMVTTLVFTESGIHRSQRIYPRDSHLYYVDPPSAKQ